MLANSEAEKLKIIASKWYIYIYMYKVGSNHLKNIHKMIENLATVTLRSTVITGTKP